MYLISFCSSFILLSTFIAQSSPAAIYYMQQGEYVIIPANFNNPLKVFCYLGKPKYLIHVWQSVVLQIDLKSNNYRQYEGVSPQIVENEYNAGRYMWINLFSWKQKQLKLDPFNQSCIGIETKEEYRVIVNVIRIDYWKVLLMVTGIFTYLSARKLSTNPVFYYLCGIVVGICASFLILIYFLSKLFPRKPLMYGVAACGWTVGIYIIQLIFENIREILSNYTPYLVWYVVITGIISFIICYRWGPVENARTKNLMRWMLQLIGLCAIYCSTHFQEAAIAQIVLLIFFHNIPTVWVTKIKKFWKQKFPPKVKLLTNDEYYEQGVRETTKALKNLREFCSSPQCNQWKTALKLQDVKRFASFMEGNSHLSDEEILEYETSLQTICLTDDEEILTDDE